MKKILFIFGTRPEGIKLATLIHRFRNDMNFTPIVCITSQHQGLLMQVLNFFKIYPNYDLNIMMQNQSLNYVTSKTVLELENIYKIEKPDITFVQGDTNSCFAGALASFYAKVPVAHIEAGLRTFDKYFPFPEEINRQITTLLSDLHFAPTKMAVQNLIQENINPDKIFLVGNTGIDAQKYALKQIEQFEPNYFSRFSAIDFSKKIILLTCHRRENFGEPLKNIFEGILEITSSFNEVEIIYPVHPNPNISSLAYSMLKNSRIHLLEPLDYSELLFIMKNSYLIMTDSGGIQEEAPSLGKPVLILREKTERQESIDCGVAKIVGSNKKTIIESVADLLSNKKSYKKMSKIVFPYGEGNASEKIYEIICHYFYNKTSPNKS